MNGRKRGKLDGLRTLSDHEIHDSRPLLQDRRLCTSSIPRPALFHAVHTAGFNTVAPSSILTEAIPESKRLKDLEATGAQGSESMKSIARADVDRCHLFDFVACFREPGWLLPRAL